MRYNEVVEYLQNLTNGDFSQSEIGRIIGKTRATINSRKINNSAFAPEEIAQIRKYYERKMNYTRSLTSSVQNPIQYLDASDEITLDYYPEIEISCGNGIEPLNGTKEQITISLNAIKGFSRGATYTVVNAVSDSMTPEIQPKDLLIVEHCQQIKDNHIYIFIYEGSLYCKYLSNNLGQIIVRSANELYPVRYIENTDEFYLIGEVKGHIRNYG